MYQGGDPEWDNKIVHPPMLLYTGSRWFATYNPTRVIDVYNKLLALNYTLEEIDNVVLPSESHGKCFLSR